MRHTSGIFGKRTSMITLSKNGMDFSFPACAEKIDRLNQVKNTQFFHRIVAENRSRAFIRLFAEDLCYRRRMNSSAKQIEIATFEFARVK